MRKNYEAVLGLHRCTPKRNLSPVLYFFYSADLLEICDEPGVDSSAMGFVNDVNVFAYGTTTEQNCQLLEKLYKQCEKWASRHGPVFALEKYKLIHFAKNPKKFNVAATIQIASKMIKLKTDIRILGLQINSRLK